MNLIYFGEEWKERCPEVAPAANADTLEWVHDDVAIKAALRSGELVTMRQATNKEMDMLEQYVGLWELGREWRLNMEALICNSARNGPQRWAAFAPVMSEVLQNLESHFDLFNAPGDILQSANASQEV